VESSTGSVGACLFVLGSIAIAGCSCESTPRLRSCRSADECDPGLLCIDDRCRPSTDLARDGGSLDGAAASPSDGTVASDAALPDRVCAKVESAARVIRRPIDAIVIPDESASMASARDSVASAMDTTFRTAMEAAEIDYRVVWHGAASLPMLEATGRLSRNAVGLGSGDGAMFTPVLDTYDSWTPSLRTDALKVFVHFTDATSGNGGTIAGYTGMFDEVLVARDPVLWGTPGAYQFVYHTFVGLPTAEPIDVPYLPTDPVVEGSCAEAFINPPPLQEMARRTGGYRFPLCHFEHFGAVFARIAESAIMRAGIDCELALPEAPEGATIDLATLAVRVTAGGGGSTVLRRAPTPIECDASSFVLETDRVALCPEACAIVEADPDASLTVITGCDPALY
jgi:hypothetical protein